MAARRVENVEAVRVLVERRLIGEKSRHETTTGGVVDSTVTVVFALLALVPAAGGVGQSERRRRRARARSENQRVEFAGDRSRGPGKDVDARRARCEPAKSKPAPSVSDAAAARKRDGKSVRGVRVGIADRDRRKRRVSLKGAILCPATVPEMVGDCARISAVAPEFGV